MHFVEEKQSNFILKRGRIGQKKNMTITECKKILVTVLKKGNFEKTLMCS